VTLFSAGITAASAPTGIVRAPDDSFYFAEFAASKIARVTRTGVITEFNLPASRGPTNIILGPDNKLWFTENTGDRIGRIDPAAGSDANIQASIVEFGVPGAGSAPNDITVGPDGALWFTETGSDEIGRITIAGVVTNEFAVPGAGSAPGGIAAGSDGALWFTEAGAGQIGRLTTAGNFTEFNIPVPNAGAMSDPEDIVAGPGGHLYFTDFGRDQIGRITTSGVITQFNLQTGRGPQQLTVFSDGDLYFTEAASSRIGRLPASALAVGAPTSGVPPLEEFDFIPRDSAPLGITIDKGGDIWFTLNNGNAIGNFLSHLQQLTITGTGSTVQVYDVHLNLVRAFQPFGNLPIQFNVAVGDTNGNGIPDAIVGAGPGGAPHVQVFDGSDNRLLGSFFAFAPGFSGGITVGSDDVNGDGRADIIVGAGPGGAPHVKVIDGTKINQIQADGQIADSALLASFFAFAPAFPGGVNVTSGDINKDNRNEVVVGAGPGGAPHVKVIDATKLNQVQADGQIANSALLGSFFAFAPQFTGGVYVGVSKNVAQRNIIVGAGPGGGPHVKLIDGTKLGQIQADGQISDSSLLAGFFAYTRTFSGGVRVAADDLNFDGNAEIITAAGPGGGPHVKVIDGTKLSQVQPDFQIADTALLSSLFTAGANFTGGVVVASDADHRDGPIFGPPGVTITNSRRDINDMFLFQSPTNAANTVMIMDVSPFATATTPDAFDTGVLYDFRVSNRDLVNTTDDLTFRMTFGPPDAAANNQQDVEVRALPAAKFPGVGGVIVKGFTKQNVPVRGVGGSGAMFRAAEQDDPFFFDSPGFNLLLNQPTAVAGVVAGVFPRGTSPNGFGPGSTPNYDAANFFGPAVNTLSIIMELPSAKLTGPAGDAIGFWGRTEVNGVQADRMGRPAINTALIPPVPRGTTFPIGGTSDQNRQDRRTAFNSGHPRDDRANFGADMVSVLTAFYPAGRPGGNPSAAQAGVVANLLLPDILVYRPSSSAGFAGDLANVNGTTFLAGGRKLSDDIISTELSVLTDDDLPAGLGGGPNPPAIVTQNVRDDNLLNLTDGSIDPPAPRGHGAAGTGSQRPAVFPYIGARNPNPTGVPGGNPPP
jgi:streptogramin lyase